MVNATDSKNNIMNKTVKKEKLYTEGMLFEVRMTSRYITIMGNQAFEKLDLKMNFEEYIILDTISHNNGICHRDLAKMLLRDRSNIGKIAANLQKCGYVDIRPDIRNNRVVKKIFITDEGINICNDIHEKIAPCIKTFNDTIPEEEQKIITEYMKKCREILEKIVDTQI